MDKTHHSTIKRLTVDKKKIILAILIIKLKNTFHSILIYITQANNPAVLNFYLTFNNFYFVKHILIPHNGSHARYVLCCTKSDHSSHCIPY